VSNNFGTSSDTVAQLQWREDGAQLAAFIDCTQSSQAKPGFSDGIGPDTPCGFDQGDCLTAISVKKLWDRRLSAC
jgi:hypothetical protein